MRFAYIIYICFLNVIQAIIIANNAKIWPPSLLAFSPSLNKTTCSEKILEYTILGVGQNKTTNKTTNNNNNNNLCLSNSVIGLIWSLPEIFDILKHSSIILEAKIVKHDLVLWYNITSLYIAQ